MSEGTEDKISGKAQELGGKAEQGVGKFVGDDELKGRGAVDEAAGKGQGIMGKAKDALGGVADSVKGAADSVGDKFKDADAKNENR